MRFFFFNDTAPTEIYTLSLHDALPICTSRSGPAAGGACALPGSGSTSGVPLFSPTFQRVINKPFGGWVFKPRSEEHTSELQSQSNLVCRLLLEKKKKKTEKSDQPHPQ